MDVNEELKFCENSKKIGGSRGGRVSKRKRKTLQTETT